MGVVKLIENIVIEIDMVTSLFHLCTSRTKVFRCEYVTEERLNLELIHLQFILENSLITLQYIIYNDKDSECSLENRFSISRSFIHKTLKEVETRSLVKLTEALGTEKTYCSNNYLHAIVNQIKNSK